MTAVVVRPSCDAVRRRRSSAVEAHADYEDSMQSGVGLAMSRAAIPNWLLSCGAVDR